MSFEQSQAWIAERCLLEAVCQQIVTDCGVTRGPLGVDITLGPIAHPQHPPNKPFYAVYSGGFRRLAAADAALMRSYSIRVTVLFKIANMAPVYKWAPEMASPIVGPHVERMIDGLHQNYDLIDRANDAMSAQGLHACFHGALLCENAGSYAPASSSMWGGGNPDTNTGIMRTVQFGGAEL